MSNPVILCVAPNGARKMKEDHQALPITPVELADEAEACVKVGASMIHLHVRDEENKHSIAPEFYRPAIEAIRARVGDDIIIQVTTEAVGIYSAAEQMDMVRDLKPEAVSLALKELCPIEGEVEAGAFFKWVLEQGISAQYILYSVEDIERFKLLHMQGVIPDSKPNILLVLGRYSVDLTSSPDDLLPMLEALKGFDCVWAVCAFGPQEADCMSLAVEHGGHCRIGFENNIINVDGEIAKTNATLIHSFAEKLTSMGRSAASVSEAKSILGMRN